MGKKPTNTSGLWNARTFFVPSAYPACLSSDSFTRPRTAWPRKILRNYRVRPECDQTKAADSIENYREVIISPGVQTRRFCRPNIASSTFLASSRGLLVVIWIRTGWDASCARGNGHLYQDCRELVTFRFSMKTSRVIYAEWLGAGHAFRVLGRFSGCPLLSAPPHTHTPLVFLAGARES